ncbi:MAG TPA: hypothetical protein VN420_05250 [Candidatus Fimivivens sp.]|nr:hypothetical protein [Candidatus Fimivivens sp.]
MNTSFVRGILVIALVLMGVSILNVSSFSRILFPIVLFSIAVSLSFSRGFIRAMPSVITIGLVADVAALGRIGLLSALSVGLAYTASFFSRRFAIEHGFMMHVSAGILVGVGAVAFICMASIISDPASWVGILTGLRFGPVTFSIASGIVVYSFVSAVMRRVETWLSYLEPHHSF